MELFFLRFFDYESEALLVFEVKRKYPSKEELYKEVARVFKKYLELFYLEEMAEREMYGLDFWPEEISLFSFYEQVLDENFEEDPVYCETPPLAWVKFGFFEELKRLGLELLKPDYELEVYGHYCLKGSKPFWYLKGSETSPKTIHYWLKRV